MKTGYYLRIFDRLSFLIQMLISVFIDLRYFLLLYSIFIFTFSLLLCVLIKKTGDDYKGIDSSMALIFIALRTCFGDNDMDAYAINTDNKSMTWAVWLFIIVVGNVVFMNFIIAVVNESYANCMSKMEAQGFKVKIDMIIEREAHISESRLRDPNSFPNYLLLRKVAKGGADEGHHWQGLAREINHGTHLAIKQLETNMRQEFVKIHFHQVAKIARKESLKKEAEKEAHRTKELGEQIREMKKQMKQMNERMEEINAENKELFI